MPPTIPNNVQRKLKAIAGNATNLSQALASQQQGGRSGTIPGTTSPWNQQGEREGTLHTYPVTGTSPGGWVTAGVGTEVLNNAGNPIIRMGNLLVSQHGTVLFQDGGQIYLNAAGDVVGGYSNTTGFFGGLA